MKKLINGFLSLALALSVLVTCFVFAPVSASAADTVDIKVTSATIEPGQTFTVDVQITNNPGIVSLRLDVKYDKSLLTLVGAEDKGVLGESYFNESLKSYPYTLSWSNGAANANYTVTGAIATLTFKASDTIEKNTVTNIEISTKGSNDVLGIRNNSWQPVPVTPNLTDGVVSIYPFNFYGSSLTLYDNISMNYFVNKQVIDELGYTDPYVVFEFNGKQVTKNTLQAYDANYYVFTYDDIGPKQLNEVLSGTLYATKNGQLVSSPVKEFSVADYCYGCLDYYTTSDKAEFRTLCVDLLNFGAATQVYDNYNVNNLANKDLTVAQKAMGTQNMPVVSNEHKNIAYKTVDNPTAYWYGAGLYLVNTVEIQCILYTTNIEGLSVKVESVSTGEVWNIGSTELYSAENNFYYFNFDKLQATQMREVILITIMNGDTAVSDTLSYDIESFVYDVSSQPEGSYEALKPLVSAMMKYGDAAYNYRY